MAYTSKYDISLVVPLLKTNYDEGWECNHNKGTTSLTLQYQ